MQDIRTLYSGTTDGFKMKHLNEGINDLAGIEIILIVFTISLVINILFL